VDRTRFAKHVTVENEGRALTAGDRDQSLLGILREGVGLAVRVAFGHACPECSRRVAVGILDVGIAIRERRDCLRMSRIIRVIDTRFRHLLFQELLRFDSRLFENRAQRAFGQVARMIWNGGKPPCGGIVPDFMATRRVTMEFKPK
jgi:hypothetical protein